MRLCQQLHHVIIQNPRIIQIKPWRRGVNIRPIGVKLGLRILLNLLRALVPWRLPAQPPPAQMRSSLLESNSMFCQGGQLARQTKRNIAPQVALASCKRQVGKIRHYQRVMSNKNVGDVRPADGFDIPQHAIY